MLVYRGDCGLREREGAIVLGRKWMGGLATYVGDDIVLDLGGEWDQAKEGGHVDLDREGFRG